MADTGIPHFHNDVGVATIDVGSKEFMFIDMGEDNDAICGYCGTHFRYSPSLAAGQASPPECLWRDREKAA